MARLARYLIRFRWVVLVLFTLLVAGAGLSLRQLGVDLSIMPLLEARPEQRERVRQLERDLPAVRFHLYAVLEWQEPITARQVAILERVSDALVARPELADVLSLANATLVDSSGSLPWPRSFPDLLGEREVSALVAEHPLLYGRLLSRDGRSACLCLRFSAELVEVGTLQRRIRTEVARLAPDVADLHFVGGPLVQESMTSLMMRDMFRSVLFETLVFALLLPLLFRSVRGSLLPILVVLSAMALNFGLMVVLGWEVSLLGIAVPGLILILGLCDSVHMMHRFEECLRGGLAWNAAIVEMLRRVGVACFYTSLTTGLGFLSLLVADHSAVRQFGLRASVAVLVAFVTVLILLPTCLALWPGARRARSPRGPLLLSGYGRPRMTLAITALAVLVSLVGLGRVVVDSRWMEELPVDDPVVVDLAWFERHFGGVLRMDVRLEGDLDSPEVFAFLENLRHDLLQVEGVSTVESYTDWVREIVGQERVVDATRLRGALAALDLLGDLFPRHVLSPDHRLGRLELRLEDLGSRWFEGLQDRVNQQLEGLPDGTRGEVAGYLQMAQQSGRLVVTTLLRSFLLSLLCITLFISFTFRSWQVGLVSMVPNVLPILVAIGVNGWFDIPLRIGIVMIYSLGLGLAVDDTIHFLARYREERRRRPEAPLADVLGLTLRSTGRVLVETSLLLIGGALCYLPSGFRSMFDVGILLSTIVVAALLADLFLLPVLLEWSGRQAHARPRSTDVSP